MVREASNSNRLGGPKSWAVEQLALAPPLTLSTARCAFLRQVSEAEFQPEHSSRQAFILLRGGDTQAGQSEASEPYQDWREVKLAEFISQFTARYFSLPVDARCAQWQRLMAAADGSPRLTAELRRLKPGLRVPAPSAAAGAPLIEQLDAWSRELYLLRPLERAVRRQEIFRSIENDSSKWEVAARVFAQGSQPLAELAPDLVRDLATRADRRQRAVKVERIASRTRAKARSTGQASASSGSSGGGIPWWAIYLAITICSSVLRGGCPSQQKPSKHSYQQKPVITYPVIPSAPHHNR